MTSRKADFLIPASLILLSTVPMIAGIFRLHQIIGGIATSDNARFLAAPAPFILHIIGSTLFSLAGAFQFAPGLRVQYAKWHRIVGRMLIPCGFVAALTGLWMTQFYPSVGFDGTTLYWIRMLVGVLMTIFLWFAVEAIRRRRFASHGAWMMRAYALGIGAGTQVLTHIPWFLFPNLQSVFSRTVFMAAAWIINMIVAELFIRKSAHQKP